MAEYDPDGPGPMSEGQAMGEDEVTASEPLCCTVEIRNRRGLHARAAAKFVKLAGQFDASVQVTRDGMTVGGESIMGLMMLAAGRGSAITLSVAGSQADAALAALTQLVDRLFDED